jgi:glycosyltransferase involved in cell wall biosynthesis
MHKKIYFGYRSIATSEGGQARNNAFWKTLNKLRDWKAFNIFSKTPLKRKMNMIKYYIYLFFLKKNIILIHQTCLYSLFYVNNKQFAEKWLLITKYILNRLSKRNSLFIEVNDLFYEQAKDLCLNIDDFILNFQKIIYEIKNASYIYASHEMRHYAQLTYCESKSSFVAINGAPKLFANQALTLRIIEVKKLLESSDLIKFVYAGSLNDGRQICDLIEVFINIKNATLILIGSDGDWISNSILPMNVKYLGGFDEDVAQVIVSYCDVGVIPYSEDVFYYNLCYPTKASFYLSAGIPILSTPLVELKNVLSETETTYFLPLKDWDRFVMNINKEYIDVMKKKVTTIQERFYWDEIIMNLIHSIKY